MSWLESEHWVELLKTVLYGIEEYDYDDVKPYLILA